MTTRSWHSYAGQAIGEEFKEPATIDKGEDVEWIIVKEETYEKYYGRFLVEGPLKEGNLGTGHLVHESNQNGCSEEQENDTIRDFFISKGFRIAEYSKFYVAKSVLSRTRGTYFHKIKVITDSLLLNHDE